ncbi:MAG TPA: alpha/beta hydrolase [Polyangium sp.]|jgi:pimeloyl-ACP methyl ester carboxylesterase|nr:alpha/beta hydrolase [Polyangium sp.]
MSNDIDAPLGHQPTYPFPKGWSSRRVQVGDVSLFFRYAGTGAPLVLLHGWPQHSLMWHTIGPILAKHFTVITPDQRGVGMSTITAGGYDKTTMAKDLAGLLDALGIDACYLAGYDLGAGTTAAFARDYPARVKRVAFLEFGLPGFGYELFMTPSPEWTLDSNWHLALFTVPDAAVWMLSGRERELLAWFFYHFAYSGNTSVAPEHFDAYHREISKPGALRAGISYYAAVWQDAKDNQSLEQTPLPMPALALGGESSAGAYGETLWKAVAPNLISKSIPRAGHWLGDENPEATAAALLEFFLADQNPLPPIHLP